MSCITPFLSEYIYQNLKNGIATDNHQYYSDSIHFLQIPNYDEKLIHEKIEVMVSRMQSVIELGRKIRDTKGVSVKTPLYTVTVVHSDKSVAEDLNTLASYIKDELNCLDFNIKENEEEYVEYITEPDHKEIGQALTKKYTKDLKTKLG